jgi:hypothetical protein
MVVHTTGPSSNRGSTVDEHQQWKLWPLTPSNRNTRYSTSHQSQLSSSHTYSLTRWWVAWAVVTLLGVLRNESQSIAWLILRDVIDVGLVQPCGRQQRP